MRTEDDHVFTTRITRRHVITMLFATGLLGGCTAAPSPTAAPSATKAAAPQPTAAPKATAPAPTAAPKAPASVPTAAAKAAPTVPRELQKATLRLGYLYVASHAGHFLALDKGYYRDAGFDLTIGEGQGSNSTVQLIANKRDLFGHLDASVLIQGVEKGMPIELVLPLFQRNIFGILSLPDNPVRDLDEAKGKKLAADTASAGLPMWRNLLKQRGLPEDHAQLITMDPSQKTRSLMSGTVDGIFDTIFGTASVLAEAIGKPPARLAFGDFGFQFIGSSVVVHNDTLREQPEAVRGFVEATIKGYTGAEKDPEGAVAAMRKIANPSRSDTALLGGVKDMVGFYHTDRTKGKPYGYLDPADLEDMLTLMMNIGMISRKPGLDEVYVDTQKSRR